LSATNATWSLTEKSLLRKVSLFNEYAVQFNLASARNSNFSPIFPRLGKQLAVDLSCPFLEASAKTRHNVVEAFETLVREIKKFRNKNAGPAEPSNTGEVKPKEKKAKRRCLVL
jgi:hypothetical protein